MKFIDPIELPDPKSGKEVTTLRTSVIYPAHVVATLAGIRGRPGTVQTTVNILLTKLANELKRIGITSYDPDAYESAVTECTLVLRGPVVIPSTGINSSSPAQTPDGNDRPGTLGVGRKATGNADKPADVRSASPGNRGKRS